MAFLSYTQNLNNLLTTLALSALITVWACAHRRRCTIATVHALRKTKRLFTVLANITGMTLTSVAMIAEAMFSAFQMTLWIRALKFLLVIFCFFFLEMFLINSTQIQARKQAIGCFAEKRQAIRRKCLYK